MSTSQVSSRGVTVLISSIALAALLVVGLSAYASAASSSGEVLSINQLNEPQRTADKIAESIQLDAFGHGGLAPESTRFLGSDEKALYYVGVDRLGYVCLLLDIKDSSLVAGACGTDKEISEGGLGMSAFDASIDREVAVYLVPDGTEVLSRDDQLLGSNILRVDPGNDVDVIIGSSRVSLPGLPYAPRHESD